MTISIPEKVRWQKTITENPIEDYTAKQRKRIRTVLKDESGEIRHEVSKLDDAAVEWFTPLYESNMSTKQNPVIHDVRATTLENPKGGDYWILKLFEGEEIVGSLIFNVKEQQINLVYRFFENNWKTHSFGANPSLYSDYLLCCEAAQRQKFVISHGMDRNPYGVNAAIGLAIFKLAMGCRPKVPNTNTLQEITVDELDVDAFILLDQDESAEWIQNAILLCTEETEEKYKQILGYSERLNVEVIHRKP